MKVTLLRFTSEPELVCSVAARRCRTGERVDELFENVNVARTLETCIESGHDSVLEHAVFTFHVEGVSRALLAQLTRHRLASYSVQSQRVVSGSNFDYVVPESISANEHHRFLYDCTMTNLRQAYDFLVSNGVPEEDARYVLPNAAKTSLVVTMNARELLHFFELRCCNRAQWEIRNLAKEMLHLCQKAAPLLFKNAGPPCVSKGKCTEKNPCHI